MMCSDTLFRPLSPEEVASISQHPGCLELYAEILKVQALLASQLTVVPHQVPSLQGLGTEPFSVAHR